MEGGIDGRKKNQGSYTEEVGHDIIRHDYHMTTNTYSVVIIACFRVQSTPSTCLCT